MRAKIQNTFEVTVEGQDMTKVQNIEFYIRQGSIFFEKVPVVVDEETLLVTLTYEEAMQLTPYKSCRLQFAYTVDGVDVASEIEEVTVKDLLKQEGYYVTN